MADEITIEDIDRFRRRLKIGQKVLFEIEEYDEQAIIHKRKRKGGILEKYPHHVILEYYQNGMILRRSVRYVDLYLLMRGCENL